MNVAQSATNTRIPALDGLRGIAISMVLFWHFVLCAIPAKGGTTMGYIYKAFKHSYSGVDLFFVLSGFLITGILLDNVGRPRWMKDFWIRRTFRILPIYALFLAIVLSLDFFSGERSDGFFGAPASKWPYFVMLQNFEMASSNSLGIWGITWSLAIEEQFYLFFPLLLMFPRVRNWLPIVCFGAMIGSLTLRFSGEYLYSFVLPQYRLDGLAAGAACAWIVRKPSVHKYFENQRGILLMAGGLLAMALITLRTQERNPIDHAVFALFYSSIVICTALQNNGIIARFLSTRAFCFMGAISYPLYLFHELVAWAIHLITGKPVSNDIRFWTLSVICLISSIAFAWAINKYLGEPMIRIGRRITAKSARYS